MAIGPAGWSAVGAPLTCTETAIAIGLTSWAKKNRRWYMLMITRNVCYGLFFGFGVFMLLTPYFGILAVVFGLVGIGIHTTSNPENIEFPNVGITTHGWAKFGPAWHLVSPSVSEGIDFEIFSKISHREPHSPTDHIESNPLRVSEFNQHLSVESLDSLLESEKNFLRAVNNTEIHNIRLPVLSHSGADQLEPYIISNFPDEAQQTIAGLSITELDQPLLNIAQEQIDWFSQVNQHNLHSMESVRESQLIDIKPYTEWSDSLFQEGLEKSTIVFDSTQQGWNNSTQGVDAAEEALERSVAADIIAQQEAVQRDMERAEEQIREKEAEIEIENTRQMEQLEIQLNQVKAQIETIKKQVNRIQSIPVDAQLTLYYAYGDTYGGGANSSVSTRQIRESYQIPNPAWATRQAIAELAIGEQSSLLVKHQFVQSQIENIEGMKGRMMENLNEKKNERLERLEESKKRAMRAIRKDANEVRSLEENNAELKVLLRETVQSFWLQSHRFIEAKNDTFSSILSEISTIFNRIESSNNEAIEALRKSSLSKHGGVPYYQHWVVINGELYSDTRIHSIIDFSKNSSPLTIKAGPAREQLGMKSLNTRVQFIPPHVFAASILRLMQTKVISAKFYSTISKLKVSSIIRGA